MQKVFHYLEGIPGNKKSTLFVVLLSLALVPLFTGLLHTSEVFKDIINDRLYFILIILTVNIIWLTLLYSLVKKDSLKRKHLSLTGPEIRKGLFVGFGIFIVVNVVLILKTFLVEESLWLTDKFSSLNKVYITLRLFFFNIFTGAFLEEVLCRAYAIPQVYLLLRVRIKNKMTALVLALLLTQLLFAMAHLPRDIFRFDLDLATIITKQSELFMSGIILSLVFLRTRNVVFLAVFHAFMNYGLPITGTDPDFKLYYMIAAFILVVFWEQIFGMGTPKKQLQLSALSN